MNFERIMQMCLRSFFYAIPAFLFFVAGRFAWLRLHGKQVHRVRECLLYMLVFYLCMLYGVTVFRENPDFTWLLHMQNPLASVNYVPMVQTVEMFSSMENFIYHVGGNLAWFIPFGLLMPLVFDWASGLGRTALAGAVCSLSIELLQFALHTGVSDVDDIILNMLGAVIGYGCCYLLRRFFIFSFGESVHVPPR